jgi:molybdate transport system permease protein
VSRLRAAGRQGFRALLLLAVAITVVFLALPIVAIFWEVGLAQAIDGIRSDVARDAFRVTLKTNAISMALILGVGTPAAYFLATRRFPGRSLVVTIIELPLVLPPAVAGLGLLVAFGRFGLLGEQLDSLGITVGFTQVAVILAITFVASPFYIRPAIAAFEAVDRTMLDASRTLGAGPAKTFWRVALPLAAGGLVAGAAVAFARGLGEFGATIMFAGSLQGVTQTVSLAIYQEFDVNLDIALAISALLVVTSGTLLLAVKALPLWTGSRSTSRFPFARSAST